MKEQGFETEWKLNKKHIVFTDVKRKMLGEKKCKTRLYKLAQYFPQLKDFQTKEDLLYGITNKHIDIAAVSSEQRENGTDRKLIDFNKGFEQYSARIDSERSEHTVTEDVGQSADHARRDTERTEHEQQVSSSAIPKRESNTGISR